MMNLYLLSLALPAAVSALQAGHVFGIKARTPDNADIDGRSLYVYGDSTLGLHDPFNDVPQFQGVIMPEYGVIFQPEPCMVLKLSDRSIFTVSSSLYNPSVGFYEEGGFLKNNNPDTRFVICPTWNEVLLVDDGHREVCADAVAVDLEITTE